MNRLFKNINYNNNSYLYTFTKTISFYTNKLSYCSSRIDSNNSNSISNNNSCTSVKSENNNNNNNHKYKNIKYHKEYNNKNEDKNNININLKGLDDDKFNRNNRIKRYQNKPKIEIIDSKIAKESKEFNDFKDIIKILSDENNDFLKEWNKYKNSIPDYYKASVLVNALNNRKSEHVNRSVITNLMCDQDFMNGSKSLHQSSTITNIPLLFDLVLMLSAEDSNIKQQIQQSQLQQLNNINNENILNNEDAVKYQLSDELLEILYSMPDQRMRDELFKYLVSSFLQLNRYELALLWYARVATLTLSDIVRPICVFYFIIHHKLRIQQLEETQSASKEIEEIMLHFWNLKVQTKQVSDDAFQQYKAAQQRLLNRIHLLLPQPTLTEADKQLEEAIATRNSNLIERLLFDHYFNLNIIPPSTMLIDSLLLMTDVNNHDTFRQFLYNNFNNNNIDNKDDNNSSNNNNKYKLSKEMIGILFNPSPYLNSSLTDPNQRLNYLRNLPMQLYVNNPRIIQSILSDLFSAQENHRAIMFFLKSAKKQNVFPFLAKKIHIIRKFCQLEEDVYAHTNLIDQWVQRWEIDGIPNELKTIQIAHLLRNDKRTEALNILQSIDNRDIKLYRTIPKLLEVSIESILRPLKDNLKIEHLESNQLLFEPLNLPPLSNLSNNSNNNKDNENDRYLFLTGLFRVLNRLNASPWLILEYIDKHPEIFAKTNSLPSALLYQMVKRQSTSPQLKLLTQYPVVIGHHEPLKKLLSRLISFNIVEINMMYSNFPEKHVLSEYIITPENLKFVDEYHQNNK